MEGIDGGSTQPSEGQRGQSDGQSPPGSDSQWISSNIADLQGNRSLTLIPQLSRADLVAKKGNCLKRLAPPHFLRKNWV